MEIVLYKLVMRIGMIKKLGAGLYTYMPVGLYVIRKVGQIMHGEMSAAGAAKMLMPVMQPGELWQETGRWNKMGDELLCFKDRHEHDFVMQSTSKEVMTDIVRTETRSCEQLPVSFRQIQAKFRDERRPRFGTICDREFTMKDAYSLDRDAGGLKVSYQKMYGTHTRISQHFGLEFRAVAAGDRVIDGLGLHESHVVADTGEDAIIHCSDLDYAADIEAAEAVAPAAPRAATTEALTKTHTPGRTKCKAVAKQLEIPLQRMTKSTVLVIEIEGGEPQIWLLLLRGDRELNEIKASKVPGLADFRFVIEGEILRAFDTRPGYLGPIGMKLPVKVVANRTATVMSDFVVGTNEGDYHFTSMNWGRDLPEPEVYDPHNVVAGDPSPDGKGTLTVYYGIKVGHAFMLGTRCSEAINATFLDESGKTQPMMMGCYGTGITRIPGTAIEQGYDARGIIWPISVVPFQVMIYPMDYSHSDAVREEADRLHAELVVAGIDVVLDGRGERSGAIFVDWELTGVPFRVMVSDRGLKKGKLEFQGRCNETATVVTPADVLAMLEARLTQ